MQHEKEYGTYAAFYTVRVLGGSHDAEVLGAQIIGTALGNYAAMLGAHHAAHNKNPLPPNAFGSLMTSAQRSLDGEPTPEPAATRLPQVGDIVHYYAHADDAPLPAMVQAICDSLASGEGSVSLSVWRPHRDHFDMTPVHFSPAPKANHWSWPPPVATRPPAGHPADDGPGPDVDPQH